MSNEIATAGETLPAYLSGLPGTAVLDDNFDSDDLALPRIVLVQGTSEVGKQFADAQPGKFWHTGMDTVVDPLKFVICSRHKRVLLVAPLADGRGVLARADDYKTWDRLGEWDVVIDKKTGRTVRWAVKDLDLGASGLLAWGTGDPEFSDSSPAATMFYDYVAIFPDRPELGMAGISLSRSAIKRAKHGLNDKIALHASNGRPLQSLVFTATSTEESASVGNYYNWRFTGSGFASEEVYNSAMIQAGKLTGFRVAEDSTESAPKVHPAPVSVGDPDDAIPF